MSEFLRHLFQTQADFMIEEEKDANKDASQIMNSFVLSPTKSNIIKKVLIITSSHSVSE